MSSKRPDVLGVAIPAPEDREYADAEDDPFTPKKYRKTTKRKSQNNLFSKQRFSQTQQVNLQTPSKLKSIMKRGSLDKRVLSGNRIHAEYSIENEIHQSSQRTDNEQQIVVNRPNRKVKFKMNSQLTDVTKINRQNDMAQSNSIDFEYDSEELMESEDRVIDDVKIREHNLGSSVPNADEIV